MTEQECLDKMAPPGQFKLGKYGNGVIQILVTSVCDLGCFNCTQFSNLSSRGKPEFMSPEHFEQSVISLKYYHGVVGVFGGNPALSPHFSAYCEILHKHIPFIRRGLWCNHPRGNGKVMRETFNPAVSNLNCHLVREAYDEFKRDWPESQPFGHDRDCRHAPAGNVAMKDIVEMYKECPECDGEGSMMYQMAKERMVETKGKRVFIDDGRDWYYVTANGLEIEFKTIGMDCTECNGEGKVYNYEKAYDLISNCDINQGWSAGIGVFRGELRAWFCEIAMAQAIYHQWDISPLTHQDMVGPEVATLNIDFPEPKYSYPDTGIELSSTYETDITNPNFGLKLPEGQVRYWWQLPMNNFRMQVDKHCHECSVPLRGYGELSQSEIGTEQVSKTHAAGFKPKKKGRPVQIVDSLVQLGTGKINRLTDYMGNGKI